jgi:hypothetical protein
LSESVAESEYYNKKSKTANKLESLDCRFVKQM